jgi:tRNA-dihydrouridine synthase B
MLNIGPLTLATPVMLAPMAGYCDVAFRLIVRHFGGVGMASTDLLSPEGILRENRHSMQLAATCPEDSPLCMQIYGSATDRLCEAARWAVGHGAVIVDINMGCPVDKVTKRDGGSKLLCNVDNAVQIASRVVKAIPDTPVTVKMRLGWDDQSLVAPQLAHALEEEGVKLVTVHGRTTEMRFGGKVRHAGIAEVVQAVKHIPVIGNGDITTPQEATEMIKRTGCHGVMIGRGAISRPWLLRDVASYLCDGTIPPEPTLEDKCNMMRQHYLNILRFRESERVAIAVFHSRISWYAKALGPCRMLKDDMRVIRNHADFEAALTRFLGWRSGMDREDPNPQSNQEEDTCHV